MAPEGAESDIGTWPAGLNCHFGAETDLFNFQCSQVVTHGHRGISPLVPQKSFHGETPGVGGGGGRDSAYERGGEARRKF